MKMKTLHKLAKVSKTEEEKVAETLLAILTTNSYEEAAKKLHMTGDGLRLRRVKYGIDKRVAELPAEALDRLRMGSVRAANTFVNNLDNPTKDMEAAKEILNRVGITDKTPTVAQQFNVGGEMTLEFIGSEEKQDASTFNPVADASSERPAQV